jgi:guanosine-3',5'-bis(diphosphate) 3'-pyrophosphohydrolase
MTDRELPGDNILLLKAMDFGARRHAAQRRKGVEEVPYINHPIRVAWYIASIAEIQDARVLCAALLHDTIEDTSATEAELRREFGDVVTDLVLEVTDDKSLPKEERKRLQIEHASEVSEGAAQIKLADKTTNVEDIGEAPPENWTRERRREYLDWTEQVVDRLRNPNPALERRYRAALAQARARVAES